MKSTETCVACNRTVPAHDGVIRSDGRGKSFGFHCGRCWAQVVAEHQGVEATVLEIAPVTMRDAAGCDHEFHFRFIPAPRGIEAFELVDGAPGGYRFKVLQEDDDPAIVERLFARMRRALATRHLEPSSVQPPRSGKVSGGAADTGMSIAGDIMRGRIEWDPESSGVPSVVIDGQSFSWEEFGRMLTKFERWQFRLRIVDQSEEV